MNKRGKILKKLSQYCRISGRIKQGNLVLLTGLIMKIGKADIPSVSPLSVLQERANAWNLSFETHNRGQFMFTYQLSW